MITDKTKWVDAINWEKCGGLVPAIVQDKDTAAVLMLGYMNKEALQRTIDDSKVTFYSRTREKLWCKGETSGNYLFLKNICLDCDKDTLLIQASPAGNTCHLGSYSCFADLGNPSDYKELQILEETIQERKSSPSTSSYTSSLLEAGVEKIARKVGEEALEVVLDAMKQDRERLKEEGADLLYHLAVLFSSMDMSLRDVLEVLKSRRLSS